MRISDWSSVVCSSDLIVWASEQLRLREKPAKMILAEFNARLADRGIASISKSAWGRYSVRKAIQFRKLDQVHHISGELAATLRSEEHTSELQSLMRISYAVFCLKKKK